MSEHPLPNAALSSGQPPLSALTVTLIILALAVGSFGIGTGEFAIMGLLPDVAATFGVTTAEAGYVISAYALGVVVGVLGMLPRWWSRPRDAARPAAARSDTAAPGGPLTEPPHGV